MPDAVTGGEKARPGRCIGWLAGAVFLLACALRLPGLGRSSLWWDECHSVRVAVALAQQSWSEIAVRVREGLSSYYLILAPWAGPDDPEWVLRLPSALAGSLLAAAVALLGAEIGGRAAGWWAGIAAALSPMFVWHSREARWYPLCWLLLAAGAICFVRLLREGSWRWLLAWLAFNLLVASAYAPAGVVLVIQGACLCANPRAVAGLRALGRLGVGRADRLKAALTLALLAAGGIWAWEALLEPLVQGGSGGYRFSSVGALQPAAVAYTAVALATGYTLGPGPSEWHQMRPGQLPPLETALILAGVLALGTLLGAGAWVLLRSVERPLATALVSLILVPPIFVVAACAWTGHTYAPRYAGMSLPFILCVSALPLAGARPRWIVPWTAAGVLFALQLVSLANLHFSPRYERENIRDAARYIGAAAGNGDLVLLFGGVRLPWEHYYRGQAPWLSTFSYSEHPDGGIDTLREAVQAHGVVWSVEARIWNDPNAGRLIEALNNLGQETQRKEFTGGVTVTRVAVSPQKVRGRLLKRTQ